MRWLGWLLALLALAGCERAADRVVARPPLWRATDGDTVIWLFGTIHLLPADVRWREGKVAQAIAQSDVLITEIPDADPQAQAAAFLKAARRDGLPPLAARLAPDERTMLDGAAAAAGIPVTALDRMTTWGAALALTSGAARALGATREAAPEAVLAKAFPANRHAAFETFAGQLAIFGGLAESDQRRFLSAVLRGLRDPEADYRELLAAWTAADLSVIEQSFAEAMWDAPGLRAPLLTRRNTAWADELTRRAARPGTILVAVGAAHMVGRDGLPTLLSARGFRVARVQ